MEFLVWSSVVNEYAIHNEPETNFDYWENEYDD